MALLFRLLEEDVNWEVEMNRRDFIKTMGVSAALLALPISIWAKSNEHTVWSIGIPLPKEMREVHQFMLNQGYYWFNLFACAPTDDDPYTQSEYLYNRFDTTTKITVRQYHTGEHWRLQDHTGKWVTIHKSWAKEYLQRLCYAQQNNFIYKGVTYDGIKNTHMFTRPDGLILKIFTNG
jgi:hypothetical protein